MKKLIYDKETKSFSLDEGGTIKSYSPTLDRKTYKKRLRGLSQEFCHNIVRLILRPTSRSAKHWLHEVKPWVRKSTIVSMSVDRSISYLFDEFLQDPEGKILDADLIQTEVDIVTNEKYGIIKTQSLDDIISKIVSLYNQLENLIDNKYKPTNKEVDDLIDSWYEMMKKSPQ